MEKNIVRHGGFFWVRVIAKVIFFIIIVGSFFVKLETTESKKAELLELGIFDYISLSQVNTDNQVELLKVMYDYGRDKYEVNDELDDFSGLKNGALVVSGAFRDTIVGSILDYIAGFYGKSLLGKVIWAVLGIIVSIVLNAIGAFLGIFGLAYALLTQNASTQYYIAYIISFFITLLLAFNFIKGLD